MSNVSSVSWLISLNHNFRTMHLVSEPSDLANAIKPQEGTGGVIHIALTAQATDKKFVLLNKASDKNAVQLLGNDSKLCRERNSREKQEANAPSKSHITIGWPLVTPTGASSPTPATTPRLDQRELQNIRRVHHATAYN